MRSKSPAGMTVLPAAGRQSAPAAAASASMTFSADARARSFTVPKAPSAVSSSVAPAYGGAAIARWWVVPGRAASKAAVEATVTSVVTRNGGRGASGVVFSGCCAVTGAAVGLGAFGAPWPVVLVRAASTKTDRVTARIGEGSARPPAFIDLSLADGRDDPKLEARNGFGVITISRSIQTCNP